ncbi:hypothetical protein [Alkalicoccus daliensis]|nr:hypothetical protein [Alkalicoccus daliensis]
MTIGMLFLFGCSVDKDELDGEVSQAYIAMFEKLMEEDSALNSDKQYISIDFTEAEDLTEAEIEEIVHHFEDNYEVDIINATVPELLEREDPATGILEGIVLSVEEVTYESPSDMVIQAQKYRGMDGMIGLEMELMYEEDQWMVSESEIYEMY